jgi:hypothetical protein
LFRLRNLIAKNSDEALPRWVEWLPGIPRENTINDGKQ